MLCEVNREHKYQQMCGVCVNGPMTSIEGVSTMQSVVFRRIIAKK